MPQSSPLNWMLIITLSLMFIVICFYSSFFIIRKSGKMVCSKMFISSWKW